MFKIILTVFFISIILVGCSNNKPDNIYDQAVYDKGYSDGFNFCADRTMNDSIQTYLHNINEIPSQLRGCYLNYYLENYHRGDIVNFQAKNSSKGESILYDDYSIQIDCSKYGG